MLAIAIAISAPFASKALALESAPTTGGAILGVNADNFTNPILRSNVSSLVTPTRISACAIALPRKLRYTGDYLTPEPVVKHQGRRLVKGTDYTVSYKKNKAIGTATAIITGRGNYTGTVMRKFKIKFSNMAIAVAACRLSYSDSRIKGKAVNVKHGYRGTVTYQKYAPSKHLFSCSKAVRTTVRHWLKIDKKFPGIAIIERSHMNNSKIWKRVGTYRNGMEYKKNTKLRPGDIYNSTSSIGHTCIYVGNIIPRIVYRDYLKATNKQKKRLKKKCADLGMPSKKAVWVASHLTYMGGSAAHICKHKDAYVHSGGAIFRYVGKGNNDPRKATR